MTRQDGQDGQDGQGGQEGTERATTRVQVVDYEPAWTTAFLELRDRLWPLVRDLARTIEHVGSTAVPGLAAKPVIDVDIVVASLDVLPILARRLETIGYAHAGNLGVAGREAFRHAAADRTHHLYVCRDGCDALTNHLALRDHLRSHPQDVVSYSALKKRLAREHPDDIDAYIAGKTDFIVAVLARCGMSESSLQSISELNRR
jgi:GrpB-like predicted nucleotidyltransferase (UPF0157 family)